MSPEYAMQGLFSEKSDVFSFGVLALEIVSGRRNSSFHDDEHVLSLLGFVSLENHFSFTGTFAFCSFNIQMFTFLFILGLDTVEGRKYIFFNRSRSV